MLTSVLPRVGTVMLSFGFLILATGTFNTFMGLRAGIEGFSTTLIGAMMSAFYIGLLVGARLCGDLINRTGHIRAFTAFAALSAVVVLLHPFIVSAPAWILLRAVLGFASAGLFMCTESWINDRVTPETRGSVLSLHATVVFLGFGGGQLMLNAGDPAGPELFMIAAMLFTLGAIPVALTRTSHPEARETVPINLRTLYRIAPSGILAIVAAGLIGSSIFGVGPVFGQALGLDTTQISLLMAALVASGLVLQMPIGWLSDRFDRRGVIAAVTLAAGLLASALTGFVRMTAGNGFDWEHHGFSLLALAFLFGGTVATLYPLGIAYVNDYLEPEQRVHAAGGLVFAYGLGAVTGPLVGCHRDGMARLAGPVRLQPARRHRPAGLHLPPHAAPRLGRHP